MSTIFPTHMFWAYGNFSNVEKLCANSFVKNGYQLNIWTYGDISNAPAGAVVRDARDVIPKITIFFAPGRRHPSRVQRLFQIRCSNYDRWSLGRYRCRRS